jgi:hypothetical protein
MSAPTTKNSTATEAQNIIATVNGIIESAAQAAIIAYIPALGLPVVKQITEAIENAVANEITKLEQTGVLFLVVDIQVASEEGDLSDQIAAVKAAEGTGNALLIQTAIAHFAASQSSLVHDDGSAPPSA